MEFLHSAGLPALPQGEQSLSALKWLAEQMPGGFFIYRAEEPLELLYANSATLRIYGCQTEEELRTLTGNTFSGMVHPEDLREVQASIDEQIADGNNAELDFVEYRIIRKDGAIRWVDDYGHRANLPACGNVYYVFISDITERRRIKEEKARMEMALERERRTNEIRSDFLFNVSHDIRTPMNAVMGFSALAMQHLEEPERLREDLEKVLASGQQMMALLDDLLEMNRLENGQVVLNTEVCGLKRLMEQVLDLFRVQITEKQYNSMLIMVGERTSTEDFLTPADFTEL